jgi:hypothetical protein
MKYDTSKHHIGFRMMNGTVFEIIKTDDYYIASVNDIIMTDGDRHGRFLCDGSWSSHRLAHMMSLIGYVPLDGVKFY